MKKLNLALSIAAGLFGGILSHFAWTQPAHAQTLPSAPKEVRSQSFVLVNDKGDIEGTFSFDDSKNGFPTIKLSDGSGREIWRAGGNGMHLLGASTNHQ
jgi:hypothetical protein